MFEATAVFAVGEFAEAVGYKRRSEDRKSVVPALEFVSTCSLNDKQKFRKTKNSVVNDTFSPLLYIEKIKNLFATDICKENFRIFT